MVGIANAPKSYFSHRTDTAGPTHLPPILAIRSDPNDTLHDTAPSLMDLSGTTVTHGAVRLEFQLEIVHTTIIHTELLAWMTWDVSRAARRERRPLPRNCLRLLDPHVAQVARTRARNCRMCWRGSTVVGYCRQVASDMTYGMAEFTRWVRLRGSVILD